MILNNKCQPLSLDEFVHWHRQGVEMLPQKNTQCLKKQWF